jgi:hypothetical protein
MSTDETEHDDEELEDGELEEGELGEDGSAGDAHDDLLPPPISAEASPKPWVIAGAAATAILCLAWLAGARQLAPLESAGNDGAIYGELTFGERLSGVARTLVFVPLASLALVFGVAALAFVRQRPIGDAVALLAKCAAVAAIALLVRLVPVEIAFVKHSLDFAGPALVALGLLVPVFRLHVRDAGLAIGFTLMGLVLLALSALVVVWAITV